MKGTKKWKKKVEKTLKNFQKGIDNVKELWYTIKAVAKKDSERSLKIEQQEIKYKAKKQVQISSKSYIYSTKVKEAKIK